ncbi:YfjI family protein [Burkholderia gladioli]|uniref:YfjI family protein n=1 Tax=Burkholderia gladioli TaxID=28095 RepID=UPI003D1D060B
MPSVISEAVDEVVRNLRLPAELIAQAALGAVSLVCQPFINVQCPLYDPAPVSLFLLCISRSSGGKSVAEQRFLRAVKAFERASEEVVQEAMSDYSAEMKIWEDDGLRLAKAYREAEAGSDEAKCLRTQRVQHQKDSPVRPKKWELRFGDGTPAGLRDALVENHAVGVLSPEASPLLNGALFSQPATLSAYWSGEDRPSGLAKGNRRPVEPRLTISVMAQSDQFATYMQGRGRDAFGTGLLARFLVTSPLVADCRNRPTEIEPVPEPNVDRFNERMSEILNQPLPKPRERMTLGLTDDAKIYWKWFTESVHNELVCGNYTDDMKSFFRKIGQQASRLAALFHYFHGASGDISASAMDAAITVCEWYLWECIRVFAPYTQPGPQGMDAPQSLLQWLQEATAESWRYPKLTPHRYTERDLRNYSCIRNDPQGLEAAINSLHYQGKIAVQIGPKGGRIIYFPPWQAPAPYPMNTTFPLQSVQSIFKSPLNAAPVPAPPNPYPQAQQMSSNNIEGQINNLPPAVPANVAMERGPGYGEHDRGVEVDTDEMRAVRRLLERSAAETGLGKVSLSVKKIRRS